MQVAYHTQLASSKVVEGCKDVNEKYQIGIILNVSPAYPRSNQPADLKVAEIAELFQSKSSSDTSVKGRYPEKLIEIIKEQELMPTIRKKIY